MAGPDLITFSFSWELAAMADIMLQKHIGDLIDLKALSSSLSWTAGGASDSVTWTGISIDRGGAFATGALPRTLDAALLFDATLASGKSLSVCWDVQHSPDNSTWSDFATEASQVVATGQSGGGRAIGVSRLTLSSADDPNIASATNIPGQTPTPSINLGSAARYIRLNVVPHLASTGTDTGVIAAVGVFAGFDILQAPSS